MNKSDSHAIIYQHIQDQQEQTTNWKREEKKEYTPGQDQKCKTTG